MRRDSSTVVSLVGSPGPQVLAALQEIRNVSVLPVSPGPEETAGAAGARALREASHRSATYVLVPADPLADVAGQWQAMWDLSRPEAGRAGFEAAAAAALAGWRSGQFELPDYYLVLGEAPAGAAAAGPRPGDQEPPGAGPAGFHLGPLHAARPNRVAVAMSPGGGTGPERLPGRAAGQARTVAQALRTLPPGPWWPPLPEVLGAARGFFPGQPG